MRISDWSPDVCSSDLADGLSDRLAHGRGKTPFQRSQQFGSARRRFARIRDRSRVSPSLQAGGWRKPRSCSPPRTQSHCDCNVGNDDCFELTLPNFAASPYAARPAGEEVSWWGRSEEKKTELQSQMRNSHTVFCLT